MKEPKTSGELQEHMLWTYDGLRVGLAVIGIALPILVLVAGAVLHGVWLEPSISAYYHTETKAAPGSPPETSSSAGYLLPPLPVTWLQRL